MVKAANRKVEEFGIEGYQMPKTNFLDKSTVCKIPKAAKRDFLTSLMKAKEKIPGPD